VIALEMKCVGYFKAKFGEGSIEVTCLTPLMQEYDMAMKLMMNGVSMIETVTMTESNDSCSNTEQTGVVLTFLVAELHAFASKR
jgi:hypothetical protein